MKKWNVELVRTRAEHARVRVCAATPEQAESLALDEASDADWTIGETGDGIGIVQVTEGGQ